MELQANSVWLYIVPHGIRSLMNYIRKTYGNPPIVITENGRGLDDWHYYHPTLCMLCLLSSFFTFSQQEWTTETAHLHPSKMLWRMWSGSSTTTTTWQTWKMLYSNQALSILFLWIVIVISKVGVIIFTRSWMITEKTGATWEATSRGLCWITGSGEQDTHQDLGSTMWIIKTISRGIQRILWDGSRISWNQRKDELYIKLKQCKTTTNDSVYHRNMSLYMFSSLVID